MPSKVRTAIAGGAVVAISAGAVAAIATGAAPAIAGGAVAGAQSGAVVGGTIGIVRGVVFVEEGESRRRGAIKGGARGAAKGALAGATIGAAGATLGLVHSAWLIQNAQDLAAAAHPEGYVYTIIEKGSPELVKIGRSIEPARRILELQLDTGKILEFVSITPTVDTVALEKASHAAFDSVRQFGEWFALNPGEALSIPAEAGAETLQGLGNAAAAAVAAMPFGFRSRRNRGK